VTSPLFRTQSALAALVGRKLPGGCDDCTAYQTVAQHGPDFFVMTVHHDDTCPTLQRNPPSGSAS
jgi:hypothetical protein